MRPSLKNLASSFFMIVQIPLPTIITCSFLINIEEHLFQIFRRGQRRERIADSHAPVDDDPYPVAQLLHQ